jgi:CheY-like chemotaxis protein
MPSVLLLTADLNVMSAATGAARLSGVELASVAAGDQLVERCARENARLVVLDLSAPGLNVESLVPALRAVGAEPPRIVAFGPHVHEARLAAARDAGCDEVMSRGRFHADINAVIASALEKAAPSDL